MAYFTSYEKILFLEPEVFFAGGKNYYFKGVLLKEVLVASCMAHILFIVTRTVSGHHFE